MPSTSDKQKKFMAAVANNPEFAKKAGVPQSVGKDFAAADKVKAPNSRPDLQGINKPKTDHGSMNLFKKGGAMKDDMKEDMKMDKAQDKAMIKKAFKEHDAQEHKGGKGTKLALKKGGMPMSQDPRVAAMIAKRKVIPSAPPMMPSAPPVMPGSAPINTPAPSAMKKGGMPKKMAKGGMAMKESMGPRTMAKDVEAGSNKLTKFGQSAVQKRGMTKGTNLGDSGPSMGMMGGMKKGGKIKKMASGGMTSSRADGVAQRGKTKTKYC